MEGLSNRAEQKERIRLAIEEALEGLEPWRGELFDPERGYLGRVLRLEGIDHTAPDNRRTFANLIMIDTLGAPQDFDTIELLVEHAMFSGQSGIPGFEGWDLSDRHWTAEVVERLEMDEMAEEDPSVKPWLQEGRTIEIEGGQN